MSRLAWYSGISAALAGGVIISAFNQRANFYSACVYLAQSNLCLMILINLILLIYATLVYGLQRTCYGPLRPIEIEQLYEKAWFAITETCLAMTIFREEVGAWFLVMFVALLTGKVWGWIGEGRVEVLEQQPPANPRLFHIRLSVSLAASMLYDLWLMKYTTSMVIQQARPNMMVMFLFEFAVLTTSSFSTAFRYCISLVEASVVKKQTKDRLMELRREVQEERAELLRQREAAAAAGTEASEATQDNAPLPSEDDVDAMDIEVPGWDGRGQCILTLDLITDFVKLVIYMTFFFILLTFYGLPIHIMRDLFVTARSFLKRLTAFLRYRQATQDMNARYEDASAEDIRREDTCIICREEMRPWSVTNPAAPPPAPGAPPERPAASVNERSRPKKLPCGHILHLGCLKSWLERQQVCPTCRRTVVENPRPPRANRGGVGQPPGPGNGAGAAGAHGQAPGMRMINLGPLRFGFGQAPLQGMEQAFGRQAAQGMAGNARVFGVEFGIDRRARPQRAATALATQDQVRQLEQRISQEIQDLQLTQEELIIVEFLQAELTRLRATQGALPDSATSANAQLPTVPHAASTSSSQREQRLIVQPGSARISPGSDEIPPGVVIPEGWNLLPLLRVDDATVAGLGPGATERVLPSAVPNDENTPAATREALHPSGPSDPDSNIVPPALTSDQAASISPGTISTPSTTNDAATLPNGEGQKLGAASDSGPSNGESNRGSIDAAASSSFAPINEQETEESSRVKGKGKAVTLEDTTDEEDL